MKTVKLTKLAQVDKAIADQDLDGALDATMHIPCGEYENLAVPIMVGAINRDDLKPQRILKTDSFNAQGLEGKFVFPIKLGLALLLARKCGHGRFAITYKQA